MKNFPLIIIVVLSAALILLGIYAKMQASKAELNSLMANKYQEMMMQEKEVNEQLMVELIECREGKEVTEDGS
jgi:flagellar biosynthesis component FlhA